MSDITVEHLNEIRLAQCISDAPHGAGYWLATYEDAYQLAQDFIENLIYYYPAVRMGDVARLFGCPVIEKPEGPIQFILWCEHCGRWLRWDGSGRCQHCYNYIPGATVHTAFTHEEHHDLTPGNEQMRQRAAEQREAGVSPFVRLDD